MDAQASGPRTIRTDVPHELPPDALRHARRRWRTVGSSACGATRTTPTAAGSCASGARPRARSSAIPARLLRAAGPRAPGRGRLASGRLGRRARPHRRPDARGGPGAVGLWSGHGLFANNYGTRVGSHLLRRFANLWGCQWWQPVDDLLGTRGLRPGADGVLEANTKEDMGEHARLILLWGANLASQPNTGPAPGRGAPPRRPRRHDRRARDGGVRPSPTRRS